MFNLASLNSLTVSNLTKLAKECGIPLKKGNKSNIIKQIQDVRIDPTRLENLMRKYQKTTSKGKKTAVSSTSKLEERIVLLEEQVKFLIKKVSAIEVKISNQGSKILSGNDVRIRDLKKQIKILINPGDTITIDELLRKKQMKSYSFELIEQAIIELIDDEVFDGSEGNSKYKVDGNIGRLIKR